MRTSTALTIAGGLLLALLAGALYLLATVMHPEARIVGEWREVSWSYEKADPTDADIGIGSCIDEQLRDEISKGLLIHASETWTFAPRSLLLLKKGGASADRLKWTIKGRGHILELVFNDEAHEVYQIRELNDDALVLQFNNDRVARGIVRIVFQRVPTDA